MEIRVLGASGGCAPGCYPSSFLVNGVVAVDAGALATQLSLEEQSRITDVLLTHSHLDHVRDLPLMLINGDRTRNPLRVRSAAVTLEAVKRHLFNREMWFEAFTIPIPLILSIPVEPGATIDLGGLKATGISLRHTVPVMGWLLDDGKSAAFIGGDTDEEGCLDAVVKAAGGRLRAVFLESSFPDDQAEFAKRTGHLTPAGLARAAQALPPGVPVFATHMKPGFEAPIGAQLAASGNPALRPVKSGETIRV